MAALSKQVLSYESANYWLLLLSIDLTTFMMFQAQEGFIWSQFGSLNSSPVFPVFPCHCCGSPPPPTNHWYVSTCTIDEKHSKMVDIWHISPSYSLKHLWTEISWWPYNNGELCGSSSMHSWDIIHWIITWCISKYLSMCITGGFSKLRSQLCSCLLNCNITHVHTYVATCFRSDLLHSCTYLSTGRFVLYCWLQMLYMWLLYVVSSFVCNS